MRIQVLCALLSVAVLTAAGQSQTVHSFAVPQGGYTPTSNLHTYTDTVNGTWSLSYDPLNRVQSASASAGPYAGLGLQWTYDSFGNRLSQQNTGIPPTPGNYSSWGHFTDGTNRVTASNQAPAPGGVTYDAAGNITFDGVNNYAYDAENRLCASGNGYGITQYVYDAEGRRVAKASASSVSCYTGGTTPAVTATYVLGRSGEQVTEFNGSGVWQHTNVYADGQLLATYKSDNNLYFPFTDPLGTTRVWAPAVGTTGEKCSSLPFGDVQACSGTDPSEQHFTGKERDTESGLDYFGARYYGVA